MILKKSGRPYPVSKEIQSECFQDFCARRLYELNRRHDFFKNAAKSFAEAAHERLVESCRNGSSRIRQYSSLYVKITTGDFQEQRNQLLQLIDAGVFVFSGGSSVPRTKTRDSDPIQQFKLAYRKIYGLSNFIGLADRDRFELSGQDLEQWLMDPRKEFLLHSVGEVSDEEEEHSDSHSVANETEPSVAATTSSGYGACQIAFDFDASVPEPAPMSVVISLPERMTPHVRLKADVEMKNVDIDTVVTGLGFEERTLESTRRIFSKIHPVDAVLVEYDEPGLGREIGEIISAAGTRVTTINYETAALGNRVDDLRGRVLVDITGLAKPVIFRTIRNELRTKKMVWFCYTEAVEYYPSDADLSNIFSDASLTDDFSRFERLKSVLTGEQGPYRLLRLLESDSDETRQRSLCAFASSKHERLLSLLDDRDYDRLEIVAPPNIDARARAAHVVAEVAARNHVNASIEEIGVTDLDGLLNFMIRRYTQLYTEQGLSFELALTGSKIQAVACGILAATRKIAQCWYVKPAAFDPIRFTKGAGDTKFFFVEIQ